MKKIYSAANFVKVVSLGTTMAVLLSSASPVFSESSAIKGQDIQSTSGILIDYIIDNNGSVVFKSDIDLFDAYKVADGAVNNLQEDDCLYFFKPQVFLSLTEKLVNAPNPRAINITSDDNFRAGSNALVTGNGAAAAGENGVAVGASTNASGYASVAVGYNASATGEHGIAFGSGARGNAIDSIAIGRAASVSNMSGIAIGAGAQVSVNGGIALGPGSASVIAGGVVGYQSSIDSAYSGNGKKIASKWQSTEGILSISNAAVKETRQLTGLAAGFGDTDAVNVAQLKDLRAYTAKGWDFIINNNGGARTKLQPGDTLVLTTDSNINAVNNPNQKNLAFSLADNISINSVQAGTNTFNANGLQVTGGPSVLQAGINAAQKKITNILAGTEEGDAVNVQQLQNLKKEVADNSLIKYSESLGVIGIGSAVQGDTVLILDVNDNERIISGVADGGVTSNSTDAINGAQLYKYDKKVSQYLGGNADVLAGGAPTYTIQNVAHNNVGGAFEAVDNSITDIIGRVDNIEDNSFVAYDEQNSLLTIGKNVDINVVKINIESSDGDARKLTGVAKGEITENSTDAVNGAQLYQSSNNIKSYLGGGADVLAGGAPTYTIQSVVHNNVGGAFEAVDESLTNITGRIDGLAAGNNIIAHNADTNLITIGNGVAGTTISIVNNTQESRKITGVANGQVAENSTDAVNGAQLYQSSNNITSYLGGGANILNNAAPTYTIQSVAHNNVGGAFEAVDNSITDIYGKIAKLPSTGGGNDIVAYDADTSTITIGKDIGGTATIRLSGKAQAMRKIVGVADGIVSNSSTDAVNGAQLFQSSNNTTSYLGGGANIFDNTAPTYVIQRTAHNNVGGAFEAVDESLTNLTEKVADIVDGNSMMGFDIGSGLLTIGANIGGATISLANNTQASRKITGVANGQVSENSTDAINGAQLYQYDKKVSQYLGGNADVLAGTAPSYGIQNTAYLNVGEAFEAVDESLTNITGRIDGLAAGNNIVAYNANTNLITIGNGVAGTTISIVNDTQESRKITGVANGQVAENSTDAINGAQLYQYDKKVSQYLGGGVDVLAGGAPTYTIQNVAHNNIGGAFEAVDNSITDIYGKIAKLPSTGEGNDIVAYDADAGTITIGKDIGGTTISIVNADSASRKITGVANGILTKASTDAVNGSQLYFMSNQIATYLGGGAEYNGKWIAPNFIISHFDADGSFGNAKYENVADAFNAINESMLNINNRINEGIGGSGSSGFPWIENEGAYDASRDGQPSKIVNVAKGNIAQNSTDVVNGGQLWETNEHIKNVENKVDGISNKIDNLEDTMTNGVVRYDEDDSGNKINKVTLVGVNESDPVVIDNVANGEIEKGSKEAVNGGQLYDYTKQEIVTALDAANKYTDERIENLTMDAIDDAVKKSKQYTDMRFDVLSYGIENAQKEARQAAAIGLAVSNLRYNDAPGKLSVGFGTGVWRSQSAFALGAGYTSENGGIRSNVSITSSGGHWGVGAGLNITLN
ncbi:Vomp family autotransporter [Bartonella sp. B17]